jgi:hypothetical protein
MGLSRAFSAEVTFTEARVTSVDWVSYPIVRYDLRRCALPLSPSLNVAA